MPGIFIICLPYAAHKASPAKISAVSQKTEASFQLWRSKMHISGKKYTLKVEKT